MEEPHCKADVKYYDHNTYIVCSPLLERDLSHLSCICAMVSPAAQLSSWIQE